MRLGGSEDPSRPQHSSSSTLGDQHTRECFPAIRPLKRRLMLPSRPIWFSLSNGLASLRDRRSRDSIRQEAPSAGGSVIFRGNEDTSTIFADLFTCSWRLGEATVPGRPGLLACLLFS